MTAKGWKRTYALSPRAVRDAEISAAIESVWERSRRTYGAPRAHIELRFDQALTGGNSPHYAPVTPMTSLGGRL